MSSESVENQVIVEKILNNPDLTVNTSSPKLVVSAQNTITVSTEPTKNINKSNHSISIVPTSGSQDFDETQTTCAELKQAAQSKILPPYTNAYRGNKTNQSKTFSKTSPQKLVSSDKSISESSLSPPSVVNNKSVTVDTRTNANFNSVPVSRSTQLSIVHPKGDKVTLFNPTSTTSETSSATPKVLQDQVMQQPSSKSTNDILERNINKNVLSLTPCPSNMKTVSVVKETKVSPVTTVSKSVSPSPNSRNITPVKDNVNFNYPPKSAGKSDIHNLSPNNPIKTHSNNTSKPVVISTADLATSLFLKSPVVDNIVVCPSKMKDTTSTVSSNDCDSKNVDRIPKIIPTKNVPSAISSCISKINPQTTSIRVSSSSLTSSKKTVISEPVQISTVPETLPNSYLAMISPISNSITDNKNKKIMDALNSGSNFNLTNSVTISNNTLQLVVHPGMDSKLRNVSGETTVYPISKHTCDFISSSTSGSFRGKSGNAEIVGGGNPNPSGSSPKASSPTAVRELRSSRKESITVLQDSAVEENTSPDSRPIEEITNKPQPSCKAVEQGGVVECLTISSDEEDEEAEESEPHVSSNSDCSDISSSLINKEPPLIDAYDDAKFSDSEMNVSDRDSGAELDMTSGSGYWDLNCRTVRIGSYKFIPHGPVLVSEHGVRMDVPAINRPSETVVVKIPTREITKVLIFNGQKLPVIFYYVSVSMGARIRKLLNMTNKSENYFNPHSKDESQRRITLVLEKYSVDNGVNIATVYLERNLLEHLTYKEANALLIKSVPKDRKDVQKQIKQVPRNPVQTIMVYPPPPARGGISINTEDYSCLAEDVFLNDVIIDFYLKWLYNEKLSETDKEKTHIFSSFFYKRLTDKATPIPRDLQNSRSTDTTISPAEIRHSRVSKWTKNIDLFSKDYIIIPLNENQHWFLAIICFPGLRGPVRLADNKPIESPPPEVKIESADSSTETSESQTMFIGSTSITPIRQDIKFSVPEEEGGDADERDEADGTEEDVHLYSPTSEDSDAEYAEMELTSTGDVKSVVTRSKSEKEPIKQPCILVFDSLAGASRARIIATLRDYLRVEYKAKHNEERDFSKHVVKGACPRVPQQNNYTDCGLFVLQYVETFFEKKITDFHVPIKSLRNWFDPEIVGRKRKDIQQLLVQLMLHQGIDVNSLKLPTLNLASPSDEDSNDEYEYDDEEDYYDEEDECEDFEDDDMEDADVEEDGEDDFGHPLGYQVVEEMDVDDGGDCREKRRFRRTSLKRMYTLHDQHHSHAQQRRLRTQQQQCASEAEYMNEVVDDDEDDLDCDDGACRDYELYGAEFDLENEGIREDDVDASETVSESDIYQDLDDIHVPKARKCAANADSSGIPSRSQSGQSMPPTDRSRVLMSAGKVVRPMQTKSLVSYDDDDDDDEEDDVGAGAYYDVGDDFVNEEVEDVEGSQQEDEVDHELDEIIDEDDEADEESKRQLALANERLCALDPNSVTVLVTRGPPVPAKDSSSPGVNPSATPVTTSAVAERDSLDALKAARPFGDIESSDSPSSSIKRFRSN